MSDRNQALSLLKIARDGLAGRITELVNEHGVSFTDAIGGDYMGPECEAVLELGERLFRLNQVISSMPPEPTPDVRVQDNGPTFVITPVFPQLPTWEDYLKQVIENDTAQAARTLATLANIDMTLARRATNVFAAQYFMCDDIAAKAGSLRAQLRAGEAGSMNLIRELFGIDGPPLHRMYCALKTAI
jgi:hypothetical protein